MAVGYGWRGIIGVLTPQANTTWSLSSLSWCHLAVTIAARMVSTAARRDIRLLHYFATKLRATRQRLLVGDRHSLHGGK